MNNLIKVNYDNDHPMVSGRELHGFLEVGTQYKDWFPRMCEYGFNEGTDFCSILSESTGGRPGTDHQLTIEMAKEVSMLQRNEKGKLARRYFIQLETAWNTPEMVMSRALKMAENKMNALRLTNAQLIEQQEKDKPKVLFADSVSASNTSILVGDLAKLIKQNGVDIGQKRLFEWMRSNGYLIKQKGTGYNMPTQRAMEMGLFEVKETSITHADGHVSISRTVKVKGKGQLYFINLFIANPPYND